MKALAFSVLLIFFLLLAGGYDLSQAADYPGGDFLGDPPPVNTVAAVAGDSLPPSPDTSDKQKTKSLAAGEDLSYLEENEPQKAEIADPLEPFNRAAYHFNDKLYFWLLKPAAKGYGWVVPENARVSVKNFFSNIAFPVRFVNCLLQADIGGATTELGRFLVNTIWGIAGFLDPASSKDLQLRKQEADFGQTLGVYGLGQGFFINWPLLGPSSARDTVGILGDTFLQPLSYVNPGDAALGARAYDRVNSVSLSLGDYETLKEAAIDPYVALRDAYVQYRQKKVEARKVRE